MNSPEPEDPLIVALERRLAETRRPAPLDLRDQIPGGELIDTNGDATQPIAYLRGLPIYDDDHLALLRVLFGGRTDVKVTQVATRRFNVTSSTMRAGVIEISAGGELDWVE